MDTSGLTVPLEHPAAAGAAMHSSNRAESLDASGTGSLCTAASTRWGWGTAVGCYRHSNLE